MIREVGRGGMGVVYEAEQISLGRRVALKVLPFAATMDARQLQRFHNEARAAASLHHEHIVPVYGVGCERGVHFYAMQFIDGLTLAQLIARDAEEQTGDRGAGAADTTARPSVTRTPRDAAYFRRVAGWGIQAALALEHAHSMGIVHRDVKPGNLMIERAGKLWVADFGLARTAPEGNLTMTGDVLGTLRYMSPEQALAKHGLVDHRTDVYSLGVTLYELLAGRAAVSDADKAEILRKIAEEEPSSLRRLHPSIPVDLETILLKATAKEPAHRYATAKQLAEDLKRFLEHQPIHARRAGLAVRLQKWGRRHRGVTLAAAVGLLVTLIVLGCSTLLLWREQDRVNKLLIEKDTQFRRAEEQQRRAEANFHQMLNTTTDFLVLVDEAEVLQVRHALEAQLDKQLLRLKDKAGDDPVALRDAAWSYEHVGTYYLGRDRYSHSEQKYRIALALYERLEAEHPEDTSIHYPLSRCRQVVALALFAAGRTTEAKEAYRQALAQYQRRLELYPDCRTHLDYSSFLCTCPIVEFRDPHKALRLAVLARELFREGDDYGESVCWRNLGLAHFRVGNHADALACLRTCIEISGICDTWVCFFLAMAHHGRGERDLARECYDEGVRLMGGRDHRYGRCSPSVRLVHDEAAVVLGIRASPKREIRGSGK